MRHFIFTLNYGKNEQKPKSIFDKYFVKINYITENIAIILKKCIETIFCWITL